MWYRDTCSYHITWRRIMIQYVRGMCTSTRTRIQQYARLPLLCCCTHVQPAHDPRRRSYNTTAATAAVYTNKSSYLSWHPKSLKSTHHPAPTTSPPTVSRLVSYSWAPAGIIPLLLYQLIPHTSTILCLGGQDREVVTIMIYFYSARLSRPCTPRHPHYSYYDSKRFSSAAHVVSTSTPYIAVPSSYTRSTWCESMYSYYVRSIILVPVGARDTFQFSVGVTRQPEQERNHEQFWAGVTRQPEQNGSQQWTEQHLLCSSCLGNVQCTEILLYRSIAVLYDVGILRIWYSAGVCWFFIYVLWETDEPIVQSVVGLVSGPSIKFCEHHFVCRMTAKIRKSEKVKKSKIQKYIKQNQQEQVSKAAVHTCTQGRWSRVMLYSSWYYKQVLSSVPRNLVQQYIHLYYSSFSRVYEVPFMY